MRWSEAMRRESGDFFFLLKEELWKICILQQLTWGTIDVQYQTYMYLDILLSEVLSVKNNR